MSIAEPNAISLATVVEGNTSATGALDAAADYWRSQAGRLFPMYVLAMMPHAVITGLLIDAITGELRTRAARYCLYLTAATLWRWIWLARMQQRVQDDLRAEPGKRFWSRLPQILLVRLIGNAAITWGGILIIPGFYGLFIGSFAAPLLLENDEPTTRQLRRAIGWIFHSGKRLFRVSLIFSAMTILMLFALTISQIILLRVVLPSLFGMDTADLSLTLGGWAWRLSFMYFVFLVLDAFWTVAAVFLYYDSQSRRTATDLAARLTVLIEAQA